MSNDDASFLVTSGKLIHKEKELGESQIKFCLKGQKEGLPTNHVCENPPCAAR